VHWGGRQQFEGVAAAVPLLPPPPAPGAAAYSFETYLWAYSNVMSRSMTFGALLVMAPPEGRLCPIGSECPGLRSLACAGGHAEPRPQPAGQGDLPYVMRPEPNCGPP
jgi:hypothetical protein